MAKKKHSNKNNPVKNLTKGKKNTGGRNNRGRITMRHKGGGHKRKYRNIDFIRDKEGIEARIEEIEYDPNRSAHIARVLYNDGERRYIIASKEMDEGDVIVSSEEADIEPGNRTLLSNIPVGTEVYNVELTPGKGGQMARSAGTSLKILAQKERYTHLKMASGEVRKILGKCRATIGQVSNTEHGKKNLGKAGRNRWKGVRPTVRGSAMGAHDHKYGGGEGKQPRGTKRPKDVYGNVTGGKKTRKKNKKSDRLIIKRRKSKRDKKNKK